MASIPLEQVTRHPRGLLEITRGNGCSHTRHHHGLFAIHPAPPFL